MNQKTQQSSKRETFKKTKYEVLIGYTWYGKVNKIYIYANILIAHCFGMVYIFYVFVYGLLTC